MHGLGELESAVMDVVWSAARPIRVRDVLDQLDTGRKLAYTTVMTVLDNLHRKGWVGRELEGKAYLYHATRTRAEVAARTLRDVLASSGDPEAALLHFVQSASEEESVLLRKALRRKGGSR
ncbi:putative transcriptional regulator [Kibdelosporangium banguiense]|uniref:Transcriptional regulator n=1 Tax=Kibdelosporangium banguiense TaxID=1365924 RepID=A0ABS4TM64_9PSEU|nr:BlaI/MecI/CopY family transcriptional regulator [Kibdelosporangium banguiense]MBP2325013.1 putative transcriptional regulator [Kibdelosporangium banguiense]